MVLKEKPTDYSLAGLAILCVSCLYTRAQLRSTLMFCLLTEVKENRVDKRPETLTKKRKQNQELRDSETKI